MFCLFRQNVKVSGYQTDLWTPGGRAKIIPFRYMPALLRGQGISHVGCDTGDLPSQGKQLRVSSPTWPRLPSRAWCAEGLLVLALAAPRSPWGARSLESDTIVAFLKGPRGTPITCVATSPSKWPQPCMLLGLPTMCHTLYQCIMYMWCTNVAAGHT